MRKSLPLILCVILCTASSAYAQVIRPFTTRYYNPSVKGNIIYVANSSISTSGIGSGNPGTGEVAPAGLSKDNSGTGINLDIDNTTSTLSAYSSTWKYLDNNTRPANWEAVAYNDAAWLTGTGKFGWGWSTPTTCLTNGCGVGTCISLPGGCNTRYPAYYFRKTISIANINTFTSIQLNVKRNDGVVIYVNGLEVARDNMPVGVISHTTYASSAIATGVAEDYSVTLNSSYFISGTNTIAVEIHSEKAKAADVTFDMEVVGIDNKGTFNSTSADLSLPSCSEILFAGLYWGADQGFSGTDNTWMTAAFNTVKLKLPGGSYQTITSTQTDTHSATNSPGLPHTGYLCFADITSLMNQVNANGTYTVADVLGPTGIMNSCAGWTIVIAYSNASLAPRNLSVFDGSVIINGGDPAVDVNISGFLTPPSGIVSCELGAVVYDGDRGSVDSFAFKQNSAASFYDLANTTVPLNGTADAFNSKVSHKGAIVTTRNPAFQNTLGFDASIFDLPNTGNAQLSNSQTSAKVRFASPGENYFVHVVTTSISQYNPTYAFDKTATDINGATLRPGDSVRYQLNYQNVGNDGSNNTVIIDNIPAGTSYLRGSLKINGVAKTDGSGDDQAEYDNTNNRVVFRIGTTANSTTGGVIAAAASGNVSFDVVIASSCTIQSCVPTIENSARINYNGITSGTALYDSSGVYTSGCLAQDPVFIVPSGNCYNPADTLIVNACPVTSVTIPWRKYAGYTIYSSQPFIAANIFDPANAITTSHVYWAYFNNAPGCSDTVRINMIVTPCPDIDDDNDGIPDYVEFNNTLSLADHNSNSVLNWNDASYPGFVNNNSDNVNDNFDWGADSDNDGIPNFYDQNFWVTWVDINGDGVNDASDADLDGIPNQYDLDSDNDGIPDVVESFGVDTNGDGRIDNYSDTDNDGFSQNVDGNNAGVTGSGLGLGAQNLDNDLVANYVDLDSDNDGIPDIIEALYTDTDYNGRIDNFIDIDGDGLSDQVDGDVGNDAVAENATNSLLRTGTDISPVDGMADSYPYKNFDYDSRANPYDIDSDMDGITDVWEATFPDTDYNGFIDGSVSADGWNTALHNVPLNLANSDGRGNPDYLDIDSDDDGISDNVEGQTTAGYYLPLYVDTDVDGLDNAYDNQVGLGGRGVFLSDKDMDGIPDFRDLDTDADGYLDIYEGNDFNLNGMFDDNVTLTMLDTDGDGLDNRFDSINSVINIRGTSYRMGNTGTFIGDPTPGSRTVVQKTGSPAADRDWRSSGSVLDVQLLTFKGMLRNNIVKLDWNMISSTAIDHFEIERSFDITTFRTINNLRKDVKLNELQYFETEDNISGLQKDWIYYKLKVIGANGKVKYSNIISIKVVNAQQPVTIFPNPASDKVSVRFFTQETEVTIRIIDKVGKVVTKLSQLTKSGENEIIIHDLDKYPKGVYSLQITQAHESQTLKLIITH